MNAPLRTPPDRTYWQPLGLHAAADMGARVEPMQHGHEVWHMRGETMLVRIIDGMPHALDVCGQPDGALTKPTWIEPRGSFVAAHVERRAVPPSDEASIVLVTANGTFVLDPDALISAEWTETVPTRSRAKKEQP